MKLSVLGLGLFISSKLFAKDDTVVYSGLYQAFAPNAGGQVAYSARRLSEDREWGLFANFTLTTGDWPLVGASYGRRFDLCEKYCLFQGYFQPSLGLSNAGPMLEFTWGTQLFWVLRIDFATQVYLLPQRAVIWSYPLWFGLSLPL